MRKILFARLIVHVHATQVPTIHATVLLNHKGFDLFDILWYDWYLTIVEPFYGCRCLQVAVMTHIISPDYDQVIFVELNLKQLRSWLSLIFSLSKLTQPSSLRSTFEIFLAIHPTTKGVLCLQQALNHVACHEWNASQRIIYFIIIVVVTPMAFRSHRVASCPSSAFSYLYSEHCIVPVTDQIRFKHACSLLVCLGAVIFNATYSPGSREPWLTVGARWERADPTHPRSTQMPPHISEHCSIETFYYTGVGVVFLKQSVRTMIINATA